MKNLKIIESCHLPHIYMTFNMITGKAYIGQHVGTGSNYYLGSGIYLKNSIVKYGKDNFSKIILKYWDDGLALDIDFWESFYINLYETYNPKIGYNLTKDGTGRKQYGQEPWNKGKIVTNPETLRKLSEGHKNSNYRPTPEHLENQRKAALGKKKDPKAVLKMRKTQGKPVLQINSTTSEVLNRYDSASFAAEALNLPKNIDSVKRSIRQACTGERKQAQGYFWAYEG